MESRWNQGIIYIDQEKGAICVGDPSDILFSETCEQVNDCITRHKLTYKNTGEKVEIIPVFETVTEGEPDFYMIPCCAYQGNEWGTCREPKGMERDGKPWIFSSDRVAVPGCSIVEMQESCHALFADHTAPSSDASSTVYVREGNTIQRIYFSHVEYPVTYVRKFDYDPPVIRYLTLDRGEEMSFTCYTYSCPKSNPGELYGYVSLFDFINTEYLEMLEETVSAQRVKELNFDFIESVTECKEGKYISNIGFLPDGVHRNGDPNSTFLFRKGGNYEIGWCGQNISVAEMYIRRYLEKGCQTDLEIGTGIMDTWLERRYENGLMSTTHLDGGGVHRTLGVVLLDLGFQVTADSRQGSPCVEGVDAVAGEAEYVGPRLHIVEDLVAGVALTQYAELKFVGLSGVFLGVGVAHLLEHLLILLGAPHRQGDGAPRVGAAVVGLACTRAVSARTPPRAGRQGAAQGGQTQGKGCDLAIYFHRKSPFMLVI